MVILGLLRRVLLRRSGVNTSPLLGPTTTSLSSRTLFYRLYPIRTSTPLTGFGRVGTTGCDSSLASPRGLFSNLATRRLLRPWIAGTGEPLISAPKPLEPTMHWIPSGRRRRGTVRRSVAEATGCLGLVVWSSFCRRRLSPTIKALRCTDFVVVFGAVYLRDRPVFLSRTSLRRRYRPSKPRMKQHQNSRNFPNGGIACSTI